MTESMIIISMIAFLPAILPLVKRRFLAALGVGVLCLISIPALGFGILPGVILWFVALFLGIGSARAAKRDRQHRELMRVMRGRSQASPVRIEPTL